MSSNHRKPISRRRLLKSTVLLAEETLIGAGAFSTVALAAKAITQACFGREYRLAVYTVREQFPDANPLEIERIIEKAVADNLGRHPLPLENLSPDTATIITAYNQMYEKAQTLLSQEGLETAVKAGTVGSLSVLAAKLVSSPRLDGKVTPLFVKEKREP